MSSKLKTCLITGAAGGIGHALVKAFAEAGYKVIAIDKVPRPVDLECQAYLQADLGMFAQNEVYAAEVLEDIRNELAQKQLHALINNAAIQILGGVDTLTRCAWQSTLDVNLLAPFLLTQALANELETGRGSVINIGSIHARLTKRDFVAYATSKAALAGMTRALAVDIGNRFRINAIEPAAVETEMLIEGFLQQPESYAKLMEYHPIQRIGQAAEIASAALWLASDKCCFIHGECIRIDGGISNRLHDPT